MTTRIRLIAGSLVVGLTIAGSAAAEPLKLGVGTWVGWGPLHIAKEKGFFAEEGIEVELISIDETKARYAQFDAGDLHGLGTTVDTALNYLSDDPGYRICSRSTTPRAGTASSPPPTSRALPILRVRPCLIGKARSPSSLSACCSGTLDCL